VSFKALVIAAVVLALDRLTKLWVSAELFYSERISVWPFFDLVRWHNEGAAFSVLSTAGGWQRWFFVILGIGFSSYILYELRRLPRGERAMVWVYGLILGGALGNLVDRIWQGYVVDFLLVHYGDAYFPAFNVADSALTCGAILWIWLTVIESRTARRQKVKAQKVEVNVQNHRS